MKGPSNMTIKYENGHLKLEWIYTITRFQHETKLSGTITQFIINLNTTILKTGNIRRVLFLYKDSTGQFCFTTTEPEDGIEYETILTRSNKKQVTIQLPQEFLGLKEDSPQRAIISMFPQLRDGETGSSPKILLDVVDLPPEVNEPSLETIDGKQYLSWVLSEDEEIPEALKQFLTEDEMEDIKHKTNPVNVVVDVLSLEAAISDIKSDM